MSSAVAGVAQETAIQERIEELAVARAGLDAVVAAAGIDGDLGADIGAVISGLPRLPLAL